MREDIPVSFTCTLCNTSFQQIGLLTKHNKQVHARLLQNASCIIFEQKIIPNWTPPNCFGSLPTLEPASTFAPARKNPRPRASQSMTSPMAVNIQKDYYCATAISQTLVASTAQAIAHAPAPNSNLDLNYLNFPSIEGSVDEDADIIQDALKIDRLSPIYPPIFENVDIVGSALDFAGLMTIEHQAPILPAKTSNFDNSNYIPPEKKQKMEDFLPALPAFSNIFEPVPISRKEKAGKLNLKCQKCNTELPTQTKYDLHLKICRAPAVTTQQDGGYSGYAYSGGSGYSERYTYSQENTSVENPTIPYTNTNASDS